MFFLFPALFVRSSIGDILQTMCHIAVDLKRHFPPPFCWLVIVPLSPYTRPIISANASQVYSPLHSLRTPNLFR